MQASTPAAAPAALSVSVRALCVFAARSGDLDLRFTPAPSALEGMAGHRLVQASRGPGYEAEVPLAWQCEGLLVRGRADGFDAEALRLEEIKTCRGPADAVKPHQRALHWAQAQVYAAILCELRQLPAITVVLVYFDLESESETTLEETLTRATLYERLEALAQRYRGWARQQAQRSANLSQALHALPFPRPSFRPGQRELSRRIYQACTARRALLAQAPTGIGKTLATLFPLLKAKAGQRIDRILFLTAKTPGRAVALAALQDLSRPAQDLRVLEIEARESACLHPGKACNGEACPMARGFYDRLPAAREAAAQVGLLDRSKLRDIGISHQVCPYFLAQEMAHWCEVIVADFNYYFHPSAFLYALAREEEWQVALLVDEAHNLPDRARAMYSATLSDARLATGRAMAPPSIRRTLSLLDAEWDRAQEACTDSSNLVNAIPDGLEHAVRKAAAALSEHFAAHPQQAPGPLQELFFDILQFARLAESFDSHSVLDMTPAADGTRELALRNLIPASFLRPRFAAARSTVCFSGTLMPFEFYRDTLGLPKDTATLDIGSPFGKEQLQVLLAGQLSTRRKDRARSINRLLDIVAAQFERRPGNYLAFFSSFDYLTQAAQALAHRHPGIAHWMQQRAMGPVEREAFLARFQAGGTGIGFAVLGGIFGEGVDLPGERLVGAFIATLGMPQHDALHEHMRERMEERFGNGYEYTYLYPGIRKVVQAAGRVIRSESDEGVVVLLDERYARPEIACLLPSWWSPQPLPA